MQANKARNLVIHNDEIMSRPARTFIKKTTESMLNYWVVREKRVTLILRIFFKAIPPLFKEGFVCPFYKAPVLKAESKEKIASLCI